jgi:mannose/fructose/N-acetylgalactosamine-specific phosphotransferase system component IIC
MAGLPDWSGLLLLGLLGAMLSLDDTAFAQTWMSQPLPAGVLTGLVAGDPFTGLAIGLPLQLITIGNLPVGQTVVTEPVAPLVAATGAVLAGGYRLELLPSVDAGGSGLLLGWVLVGVVLASLAGQLAVRLERRANLLWMLAGHRDLREGNLAGFERLLVRSLALTALRGLVLSVLWYWGFRLLWIPLLSHLPEPMTDGLVLVPWLTLPVAAVVLLNRFGFRAAWSLGLLGFCLAFGLTWLGGR